MKKAVRLIAVVFLICAAAPVAAAGQSQGRLSQNSDYSQYAYLLDGYDVKITVNEDNTFDITETIDAFFNVPKHGIIRKLPIRNEVERLDGTVSRNRVKITGLAVNEPYASSVSGGYREIKIGEEETTLTGAKQYRIRYNYNIGKDTGKDYDEFYFDIIGGEWDTAVGGVTFTIAMPKEFDQSKLGFSKGRTGSTDNSGIDYEVNGRVITGRYNGVLNAGEALTVRLELPEGYFTATSYNPDFMTVASFALPVLLALLAVLIWTKYGRDEKAVETVEFYPPAGFNSAEVGFLYKGKAEANDAVSLMIYLANKGYIGIEEFEERSLFAKNKAFKLTKLKEYDGDNANERLFLTGLFNTPRMPKLSDIAGMLRSKDSAPDWANEDGRTEVTSSDLRNTFYVTVNQIVKNLNAKQNRETVFEKSSLGKGFLVGL